MKKELVDKFMEKGLKYLDSAEAFTSKEIPQYIQELMEFKVIEHITDGVFDSIVFTLSAGLVLSLVVGALVGGAVHDFMEASEKTAYKAAVVSFLITMLFMPLMGAAFNHSDFIKAYKAKTAPRVYLVDYIRGSK